MYSKHTPISSIAEMTNCFIKVYFMCNGGKMMLSQSTSR